MNDQSPLTGFSQAYVTLLSDNKVNTAEIAILKAQQTTLQDIPRLLAVQDLRLASLERSQRTLRGLGWALLMTFALFVCTEAYKTWLQVKVTPPTVVYPKFPEGPR